MLTTKSFVGEITTVIMPNFVLMMVTDTFFGLIFWHIVTFQGHCLLSILSIEYTQIIFSKRIISNLVLTNNQAHEKQDAILGMLPCVTKNNYG